MNKRKLHITIPTPCHESWSEMTATERGAFCGSCQKEVVDFSIMTDGELLLYFSTSKAECGRFRNDQLNVDLRVSSVDNGFVRWKAILLSALSLISAQTSIAQKNQVNHSLNTQSKRQLSAASGSKVELSVLVVDGKTGQVLPGVMLSLVDTVGNTVGGTTQTSDHGLATLTIDRIRFNAEHLRLKMEHTSYHTDIVALSTGVNQHDVFWLNPIATQDSSIQTSVDWTTGIISVPPTEKETKAMRIKRWFRRTFRPHH